jgi:MoaA/NifB/PqqE/SkfB family radical SAM enzyme
MKVEEIDYFTKTMKPLHHVNLTGGEPFLRDDLPKIVSLFRMNCKTQSFSIPTNGYDHNRIASITREIFHLSHDINLQINVSIDHLYDRHDKIRNFSGLFNNAILTINALKGLQLKQLVVAVSITLTKENKRDIDLIYSFVRDDIRPDKILPVLVRGNAKCSETKDVSLDSYSQFVNLWRNDIVNDVFCGYTQSLFGSLVASRDILVRKSIIDILKGKKINQQCLAGVLGCVMREDGEVFPCELLSESFGNIRSYYYDFKKVWFSSAAQKIRKKIREEHCTCGHECFQGINILFNLKSLPVLFKTLYSLKVKNTEYVNSLLNYKKNDDGGIP